MRPLLLAALLAFTIPSRPSAQATGSGSTDSTPGPARQQGGLGIRRPGPGSGVVKTLTVPATKSPRTGEATVVGSIDKDAIRKVIEDHAGEVRECYEEALAEEPQLRGTVVVKWVIQHDGSTTLATVDRSQTTLPSEAVLACILFHLDTWTFPQPGGSGVAVVTYPWLLRTRGPPSGEAATP